MEAAAGQDQLPEDAEPIALFEAWLAEAQKREINDPNADQRIAVSIMPEPGAEVRGDDLWMTVPVSEAFLKSGGRLEVTTPLGRRSLWISRSSATRGLFRAPGEGLPATETRPRGHLYLRLKLDPALADTPAKTLFNKPDRALSHGCIRVKDIARLAGQLASPDRVDDAMSTYATRTLHVQKTMPVYVVYFTAAPDENGEVETYSDPYDQDGAMIAALDHDRMPTTTPIRHTS